MLGGYQTISFNNKNIYVGYPITVDGIYSKIKNSNQKVILLGDLVIEGVPKSSMFVSVNYDGDNIVIKRYGIKFTIEPNDTVSCDQFKVDPDYLPDGGFGYEDVTNIGDTLTWDGTPTDTVVQFMTDPLTEYCRVSNNTPTAEKLVGATATLEGSTLEITDDSLVKEYGDIVAFAPEATSGAALIIVAYKDGATMAGIEIPQKGIYFIRVFEDAGITHISSLTIPNYNFTKTEVHKIDKKFLPDDIGGGGGLPSLSIDVDIRHVDGEDKYDPIILTDEQKAILNNIKDGMSPFVCKVHSIYHYADDATLPDEYYLIILYLCQATSAEFYAFPVAGADKPITFVYTNDEWVVAYE